MWPPGVLRCVVQMPGKVLTVPGWSPNRPAQLIYLPNLPCRFLLQTFLGISAPPCSPPTPSPMYDLNLLRILAPQEILPRQQGDCGGSMQSPGLRAVICWLCDHR